MPSWRNATISRWSSARVRSQARALWSREDDGAHRHTLLAEHRHIKQRTLFGFLINDGVPRRGEADAHLARWTDNSTIGPVAWSGTSSTFMVTHASGSAGLQLMIPSHAGSLRLTSLTLSGVSTAFTLQTIKGVEDAFATATAGQSKATYAP
jgi:hypothetical protein